MDQGEQPGEVAARGRHPTVASERTRHRGNLGPWGRGGSEPQVYGIWARYFRVGQAPSLGQPHYQGEQAGLFRELARAVQAMRIGLLTRAPRNKLRSRTYLSNRGELDLSRTNDEAADPQQLTRVPGRAHLRKRRQVQWPVLGPQVPWQCVADGPSWLGDRLSGYWESG